MNEYELNSGAQAIVRALVEKRNRIVGDAQMALSENEAATNEFVEMIVKELGLDSEVKYILKSRADGEIVLTEAPQLEEDEGKPEPGD